MLKTKSSSSTSSPSRHPMSVCGDCGANSPSWASVNRGILLCAECCSVHRSMGRHISQVKCLRGGAQWIPEQLTMVQSLYSCGANSIWEYSLLNPAAASSSALSSSSKVSRSSSLSNSVSSRDSHHGLNPAKMKKPKPSDPLHPNKGDFIRAKHANLSFVYRPAKDEPLVTESELSRQLHSSVRTPNLETSLRLLSQGADPNFFHPEKNSTPLQVAARAGQACQVELLLVYGADPGAIDKTGKTAAENAKSSGQAGIASRLNNAQFELSDRLSFFLCQKKPEHSSGQHFIIPEVVQDRPEDALIAKRRLQGLNNIVFEELVIDVYDEVDRRETDAIWATLEGNANKSTIINMPFLPVNPDYGTTRNQARQKLARLESREFGTLVVDVLKEIRRRQTEMSSSVVWSATLNKTSSPLREAGASLFRDSSKTKSLPMPRTASGLSDDEPIYDHVASDDDYYHIPESGPANDRILPKNSTTSSPSKSSSSGTSNNAWKKPEVTALQSTEYEQLRAQLENSEHKVQALIDSNDDMRCEISRLATMVNKLMNENLLLRNSAIGHNAEASPTHSAVYNNNSGSRHSGGGGSSSSLSGSVPSAGEMLARGSPGPKQPPPPPPLRTTAVTSIYDQPTTRSPSRHQHQVYTNSGPASLPGNYGAANRPPVLGRPPQPSFGAPVSFTQFNSGSFEADYDVRGSGSSSLPPYSHEYAVVGGIGSGSTGMGSLLSSPTYVDLLPSQEEVVRRTEAITRCIQELLISAKDEKFDEFIPCSERIVRAVGDMAALFPSLQDPTMAEDFPGVTSSLMSLTAAANRFETECRILIVRSQKEPLNQGFVTQQVIQCAFDIAKSTKQLVALFQ